VHTKACAESTKDPKTCRCKCRGTLHGSGLISAPLEDQPALSHPSKSGRGVTLTVTAAAMIMIGALTVTALFGGSSNGRNDLTVQVKVELNNALSALASLGFRIVRSPNSTASGPSYRTDCSRNATGEVRQFLTRHPCKQYASATRTLAQRGATAQVAFSWVEMPTATLAGQYRITVDAYGTGNPPGVSLAFNGRCYASSQQRATVWTVEVQPTGHVNVDREILQAAARRKLSSNYLRQHCTE
jgi:hypothetical protein